MQITTHQELSKTSFLSNLACLIPMPDCNQSPRNMYQCQVIDNYSAWRLRWSPTSKIFKTWNQNFWLFDLRWANKRWEPPAIIFISSQKRNCTAFKRRRLRFSARCTTTLSIWMITPWGRMRSWPSFRTRSVKNSADTPYRVSTDSNIHLWPNIFAATDLLECCGVKVFSNHAHIWLVLQGYDMEDAMIINKASLERGFAHGSIIKSEIVELNSVSIQISFVLPTYLGGLCLLGSLQGIVTFGKFDKYPIKSRSSSSQDGGNSLGLVVPD